MNDSTREFLLWLGIPDKMTGFELLGETLEQSMEYVRKGRKINQTDIFISLSKRHGQSYNSIDRAIRRAVDFAAYRTDETAKRNLCEVMGNVYYGSVSVKSFLYSRLEGIFQNDPLLMPETRKNRTHTPIFACNILLQRLL